MADFHKALKYTLANEGGFSNVPVDSGGATNFGITQKDLSDWSNTIASTEDVKHMTLDVAEAIYAANYWNPLHLDSITDDQVATCIFDMAVNLGVKTSALMAQACCVDLGEHLNLDGVLGPISLSVINRLSPNEFINLFFGRVRDRYQIIVDHNPSQKIFYRGWMARAVRLLSLIDTKTPGVTV